MITVIGKLKDTKKYIGVPGYNVLPEIDDWTPDMNLQWIREALERGDDFLIMSTHLLSGFFYEEVRFLLRTLTNDSRAKTARCKVVCLTERPSPRCFGA